MLPAVPRKLTTLATTLALALSVAAPAQALGKNERNVLKGVAAAVIVQQILQQANRAEARPSYQQPAPQRSWQGQGNRRHPDQGYAQPYQPPRHGYAPAVQQRSAAELVFRDYGPEGRREIQRRLAAYGYYGGAIDGIWGRGTATAMERYARDTRSSQRLQDQRGALSLYQALLG